MRVGRIYKGKPLIMCSRRDNVKQVLGQEGERERWHRVCPFVIRGSTF